MTYRIQKTIISKFIRLTEREKVIEEDLIPLLKSMEQLYQANKLTNADIFRQKLELIAGLLTDAIDSIRRKRTSKELILTVNTDLISILRSDLDGVDYSKSELNDLESFEKEPDLSISFENVLLVLENLVIPKRRLSMEADLERFLCEQFALIFGKDRIANQYSIGGFLALKTDIDIGNGQVGIELKVSDHLAATDMQRLIGQAVYYKNRFYGNKLLVLIASRSSINSTTKELKEFIEELGIKVLFKQAVL